MVSRILPNTDLILLIGLKKYYTCFWPVNNVSEQYYETNKNEFAQIGVVLEKGVLSAISAGLCTREEAITLGLTKKEQEEQNIENQNNVGELNVTISLLDCPPPLIQSFYPATGSTDTRIQVNGFNLLSTTGITVNTVEVDVSSIEIFNDETLRFSVPQFPQEIPVGKIVIRTKFGEGSSGKDFTHV